MFRSNSPLTVISSGQRHTLSRMGNRRAKAAVRSRTEVAKIREMARHNQPHGNHERASWTHAPVPAAVTPGGGIPYPRALGSGSSSMYGDVDFLQPYMDVLPRWMLCDMYWDIYNHDPVAGAAVDLMSNLPFSDFELRLPVEDPDDKMRTIFEENLDRLRINTLLPATTRESHVFGAYISVLIYDQKRKMFTDTVPFEYRNAEIRSNILYGGDPTIEVQLSAEQKVFLNGLGSADTAAYRSVANKIDPELISLMKTGHFELDPLSAIYIPRKPFSYSDVGESVYRRMLPIYLIEKSLMRGTIHMANRRQNPIIHVQVGNEEWEPTDAELDSYVDQVIESDQDPLGAVLATRNDVNIIEVGSAGQFWKWGDESDTFNNRKFMSLGISEAFLCESHDTLISTNRGILKIGEIADTSHLEKDQSVDIDLKVKGVGGRPVPAVKLWYRGRAPVETLFTKLGHEITVTDDHPMLVLGDDLKMKWKRAKHLCSQDHLAIDLRGVDMDVKNTPFNLPDYAPDRLCVRYTKPKVMSEDLAYVMGLLSAEGCINNGTIAIGNTDKQILLHYMKCMQSVFGKNIKFNKRIRKATKGGEVDGIKISGTKKYCDLPVSSVELASWLNALGMNDNMPDKEDRTATPSWYKTVPWSIMQSTRDMKLAFLAGFIDGDGSIYKSGDISLFSASGSMQNSLQAVLLDMGYMSFRMENIRNQVSLNKAYGVGLCREILPYLGSARKRKNAAVAAKKERKRRTYGLPIGPVRAFLRDRHITRINNVGSVFKTDDGKRILIKKFAGRVTSCIGNIHKEEVERKRLLYDSFDAGYLDDLMDIVQQVSPSFHGRLNALMKRRFMFDEFAAREMPPEPQRVYDLSIGDGHVPAFCANGGIIVHNSGDANWSSLEHALTVFLDMIRSIRHITTNQFFYNKVFPLISSIHEFTHEKYGNKSKHIVDADGNPISSNEESRAGYRYWTNDIDIGYTGGLIIPIIEWEKKLMPEGDAERLEVMERLSEKGVPFPLRTWAAVGGYNLDQLVREMENSTSVEAALKKVMEERDKVLGTPKDKDDGDGGGSDEFFSLMREVGVTNREYPEETSEIAGRTKTGRRRYIPRQHELNRMMDQRIIKVLADLAKKAKQ